MQTENENNNVHEKQHLSWQKNPVHRKVERQYNQNTKKNDSVPKKSCTSISSSIKRLDPQLLMSF